MIIELPEDFEFTEENSLGNAYIQKGVLYIDGNVNYENLMYALAYKIHGKEVCGYCKKAMTLHNRTVDHMFPRAWGGVSITNNLLPACRECNNVKKRAMTYEQFLKWKKFKTDEARIKYYQIAIVENENLVNQGILIFPKEFMVDYDITEVLKEIDLSHIRSNSKIQKYISEYYNICHKYKHPIIFSNNGWLLDGSNILYHAKKHNEKILKAIVLENVVKIRKAKKGCG